MRSLERLLLCANFRKSAPFVLVFVWSVVGSPIDFYTGTAVQETETSVGRMVL